MKILNNNASSRTTKPFSTLNQTGPQTPFVTPCKLPFHPSAPHPVETSSSGSRKVKPHDSVRQQFLSPPHRYPPANDPLAPDIEREGCADGHVRPISSLSPRQNKLLQKPGVGEGLCQVACLTLRFLSTHSSSRMVAAGQGGGKEPTGWTPARCRLATGLVRWQRWWCVVAGRSGRGWRGSWTARMG
ncbi:hypothetical protein VTI74DRAFT_8965 [Chaetomium olivicolor]